MANIALQPFLKWPGGKRWLVDKVVSNISLAPENKYIEPFLGSGAVFFALQPKQALLSDINSELIELFLVMRDKPFELQEKMIWHQKHHSNDYYYSTRAKQPRTDVNRAARMLYLNRTCFNGMYRVNKFGKFNVPIGSKGNCIYDIDSFSDYAELLKTAEICNKDFEEIINMAQPGDYIFADPPYAVGERIIFTKYNDKLFTWNDQIRLFSALNLAKEKNVHIISTNVYCKELFEMYSKAGFNVISINRPCMIAGNPEKRRSVQELIVSTEPMEM